ncbi:glycogen-binding domain-containing protein [Gemmatimonas sp.]|uniref:glycogen-binding domain-containing protein n=1 Tax=Gemmatimonas sp. TaxID=1962908 RepID=UPI003982E788
MTRALLPCVLASLTIAPSLAAQVRGDAPIAPAATIGPVTDASTLSVLGMAALRDGAGNSLTQRNDLWLGATQPLGRIGRIRFAALGTGNWRVPQGVGSDGQLEGTLAVRARARVGDQRVWSAISYGHASVNGANPTADILGNAMPPMIAGGLDLRAVDTTVSRRVDVGAISRAEAGVMTNASGMEFSFGFSVERATRTTTQTLTIDEPDAIIMPTVGGSTRLVSNRTTRSLQRRDIATGIASLGFHTGATTWLVSVTSPVATWISSDALLPKPSALPTVASLAVVQPITAWLSLVGAAATNAATVGGTALRDDLDNQRARSFAPVLAIGVRIARLPFRGTDGTPGGILAFETRTLGAVDSLAVEQGISAPDGDTLRVVLLIDAPRAESVELMGDATEWMVTQMQRGTNGRWRAELKLAPGMHRITVRADRGAWISPPGLPIGNDDYGSPVGMIMVRGKRR